MAAGLGWDESLKWVLRKKAARIEATPGHKFIVSLWDWKQISQQTNKQKSRAIPIDLQHILAAHIHMFEQFSNAVNYHGICLLDVGCSLGALWTLTNLR